MTASEGLQTVVETVTKVQEEVNSTPAPAPSVDLPYRGTGNLTVEVDKSASCGWTKLTCSRGVTSVEISGYSSDLKALARAIVDAKLRY